MCRTHQPDLSTEPFTVCYKSAIESFPAVQPLKQKKIERFCYTGTALQFIAWGFALFLSESYIGLIIAIILADVGAQCHQLSNQSGCLAMVPEATNRCNTVFMSHLFAGGSIGTLSAGVAWDYMGWTDVCLVGIAFATLSLERTATCGYRAKLHLAYIPWVSLRPAWAMRRLPFQGVQVFDGDPVYRFHTYESS